MKRYFAGDYAGFAQGEAQFTPDASGIVVCPEAVAEAFGLVYAGPAAVPGESLSTIADDDTKPKKRGRAKP